MVSSLLASPMIPPACQVPVGEGLGTPPHYRTINKIPQRHTREGQPFTGMAMWNFIFAANPNGVLVGVGQIFDRLNLQKIAFTRLVNNA